MLTNDVDNNIGPPPLLPIAGENANGLPDSTSTNAVESVLQ
jgi:hypothetical protein